jgi:putative ABC transport system permease protein
MIGASALLTLLLSAIGLYGLLSLAVAQGRRDNGIRLALGGSRPRVVGQVVRSALGLVALALGIGLAAALGAARGLAHHLYDIDPHDPATLAAAVALFALVAAAAAWWPARRAARVDPAVTLRQG